MKVWCADGSVQEADDTEAIVIRVLPISDTVVHVWGTEDDKRRQVADYVRLTRESVAVVTLPEKDLELVRNRNDIDPNLYENAAAEMRAKCAARGTS